MRQKKLRVENDGCAEKGLVCVGGCVRAGEGGGGGCGI